VRRNKRRSEKTPVISAAHLLAEVVAGKAIAHMHARPSVDDYTPGGRDAGEPNAPSLRQVVLTS
jgi:hypothetical protein